MEFTKEALGNCEYFNYYQGYQEICLYFMIIFGRKQGPKYMTMFSKIFLDYALSKKYQINYEMILDILNDCCNLVNKKVVLCSVHIIIAYNNNVMKRPKTSLSLKKKNAPLPRGDAKIRKKTNARKKNPRTGWRAGIP